MSAEDISVLMCVHYTVAVLLLVT